MKSKARIRIAAAVALTIGVMAASQTSLSQAAARFVGTITAIGGNGLTVKT